jgi:hypothetical protein
MTNSDGIRNLTAFSMPPEDGVPGGECCGAVEQRIELRCDLRGRCAAEAGGRLEDIGQRPAGDNTVKRRNQVADDHAHPANDGPRTRTAGTLGHARHRNGRTLAAQAPDQQFAHQDRYCDQGDAKHVYEHERTTAAHADDVRELPDIAETDSGTNRRKYERRA